MKRNFGIIFVAIQDRFGSTASVTSLLTTMQNLVMSFSSLFITTVGTEFLSSRMSITLGAFVFTTAHIISAFSTDIHMLFASVGFLEGLGTALSFPSVIATIGEYFDKRRGLATGLAFCGSNVGWVVLAPVLSALFEDIGYSGTFMIIAGMTFNILVTAALLRPVKSFKLHKLITKETEDTTKDIKDVGDILESENFLPVKDNVMFSSTNSIENGVQSERNKTDEILTQLVIEKENKGKMQLSADGTPSTSEIICFDLCDQPSHTRTKSSSPLLPRNTACSLANRRTSISSQDSQKGLLPLNSLAKDKKASFRRRLKASYDLTLFRSLVFPVFLLMAAMMGPTTLLLPVFLAPLSRDLGLSAERTGILMSILGGVGLFSRILCALFADRKYVKLTTLLAVVSILAGVTAHCVRFIKTFHLLVFVAVIFGLCCEIYQSMYPVILVEYLTLPKLKSCIGFTVLCHGVAAASTYPVIGSFRDATGNYIASYHFLGTMSFVGALLALSLPYLHRRQKKYVGV
ncbi:monocarboxylate transporter 12-like [Mercenaria mercenaria]|uniref:monocarboxylate transporter 12-like n=1 Tax=Mercenaria mercenaria TaxID=6596 RepID=UPI00234FA258|nr:monocarboxylate transporter 12-like [Mercenaria mercenaria]XP_053403481.1 monocarboxylate transporter 12-like [Mercenaria mercenaria]XP_053403482.1 monocarboxylate transporter 12-like [Mercenaria mercenaria]